MSRQHLISIAALLLATLATAPCSAQPIRPATDNTSYKEAPGIQLFVPSYFIQSLLSDRLLYAQMRVYNRAYEQAAERNEYGEALAYTDSLIQAAKHHRATDTNLAANYIHRAQLLHKLNQNSRACLSYDLALMLRDSLMHRKQSEAIHEMQANYELDRLALEQALLKARNHKVMLISLGLLLAAALFCILFIHRMNSRIKALQRELLQQMRDAECSEEKKIAFINSMCHEVRTPLNCVSGFAELMCSEKVTPNVYAQYCDIVRDNCRQLRYLFDDLIEVAFLESHHEPLPHTYLDLCALCRTQIHGMRLKYPRHEMAYMSEIPNEQIGINCNQKYLTMLVTLLLNNAYKFTEKGFVRLECGRAGDDQIFIAIADTGCGIPSEEHERVFERFFKLDTFSQGNGLGLYLCRLIVKHLGGTVVIDAGYTGGTRFVATLPRK